MQPTPTRVLLELQRWAPWIWSITSLLGLLVAWRLGSTAHQARKTLGRSAAAIMSSDDAQVFKTLIYLEQLAVVGGVLLALLAGVGLISVFGKQNSYIGIALLLVMLATPTTITWILYRAFRLRI